MKKIFYTKWQGNRHHPFWMPWGCLGCLGRTLLFLLLLFLLFFLLSLLRTCNGNGLEGLTRKGIPGKVLNPEQPDSIDENARFNDPTKENQRRDLKKEDNPVRSDLERSENPPVGEMPGQISDPGPYLPQPDKNVLPPVKDEDIIDDDKEKARKVANKLNVILDSTADDETFKQFAEAFKKAYPEAGYQIVYYSTYTKLIQLLVPVEEREKVKRELPSKIPQVSFRVFDETMFEGAESSVRPNDVGFKYDHIAWYFEPVQAYEAWEITQGTSSVIVAIVDSYFDMTHSELEHSRIVKPYSVRFRSTDVRPTRDCPQDDPCFFHGSAVAAQAVGTINNGVGLCGIAPKCKLMPISMGHRFTSMTMLEGILYAIYQGASVVNISAGQSFSDRIKYIPIDDQIEIARQIGKQEEDVWQYVFDLADKRNVTIVWAAGNSTIYSGLDFSKRGKNTIRVAAVDARLERADFSNFGNFTDQGILESTISAPGTEILCAAPFNTFGSGGGTSYSAPIVAGAVGLMKSLDPTLTNKQVIEILQETGKPLKGSPEIGPLLQIKDALLKVKGQFVKFDDIMENHASLVGTWQSTELLSKIDENGTHPNEVRLFFQISDISKGKLANFEATTTRYVYSAPFSITWGKDKITFMQKCEAVSPDANERYESYIFTCMPDSEGLLQCEHEGTTIKSRKYYIKKISNNPYIDITSYE